MTKAQTMTSSKMASVTAEVVSWEILTCAAVAMWCWISLMVIPPAYKLMIISSTSVSLLDSLGTMVGKNEALDYVTPEEVETEYYLSQPISTGS